MLQPYFEGERTPNLPDATASLHGMTLRNSTPATMARAHVEGMLCGLADGLDAITRQGVQVERVLLIGGGAKSRAVREIAPTIFGVPIHVPARASSSPTVPRSRPRGSSPARYPSGHSRATRSSTRRACPRFVRRTRRRRQSSGTDPVEPSLTPRPVDDPDGIGP